MEKHESNTWALAEWRTPLPQVARMHYPELEQHPQHELASRQARGYGGMLSFELDNRILTLLTR